MSLLEFMRERHNIYLNRAARLPPPWTDDPILQTYKFTNVYRELDRVTIWVRKNIREPFADHPNLWFMLAVARTINWPGTLQEALDTPLAMPVKPGHWEPAALIGVLNDRKSRGLKVYTGAYMIRAEPADDGGKNEYICNRVLGQLWGRKPIWTTLQAGTGWFQKFYGWGGFMSYEVVSDLRHTRYLCRADDIHTWANAGPGAIRGLNRVAGRPVKSPLSQSQASEEMYWLKRSTQRNWPRAWPLLEMREIEHCLCEYDKYERARLGEGRPRSLFQPTEEL